jgi:hypothetical protein
MKKNVMKNNNKAIIIEIQKIDINIEKKLAPLLINEKIFSFSNQINFKILSIYKTGTTEKVPAIIHAKNLLEWNSELSMYEKIYHQIRIGKKQNNQIRKYLKISINIIFLIYF